MFEHEFQEFSAMLDLTCSACSQGRYTPSAANTAMWWRTLAAESLENVRAGFDAHAKHPTDCKFPPAPGQILGHIRGAQADDGRPGAEEAWAISLHAADEFETLVWTEEMAQAWEVARGVFALGDKVGARMAFKEAYSRLLEAARRVGTKPAWLVCLGFDAERRKVAIAAAVQSSRLPASELAALPAPSRGSVPLLAAPVEVAGPSESQRAALLAVRKLLASRSADSAQGISIDRRAKALTAQRKAEVAERVREFKRAAS